MTETTKTPAEIRIPRTFFLDHRDRDLPTPTPIRVLRRVIVVSASDPAVSDLLADARYYSDSSGFLREYREVCASARRTVAAIERAMRAIR